MNKRNTLILSVAALIGVVVVLYAVLPYTIIHEYEVGMFPFQEFFLYLSMGTRTYENDREFNLDYHSLISPAKMDEIRQPAIPYISGDTLRTFADHIIDDAILPWHCNETCIRLRILRNESFHMAPLLKFNPAAVQPGHVIFVQANFVDAFFAQHHPKIAHPYILITHNSDLPSGRKHLISYLQDTKLIAWYGHNVVTRHPKLHAIPLGIANSFWPYGNVTILRSVSRHLKPFAERKNILYVNFDLTTNSNRSTVLKYLFDEFGNETTVQIVRKRTTWQEYLSHLGNTKYVISPPGNGIDCYRTWEALIMGAIPIVLRSELQQLYDDMPILVLNDWRELTRDFLSEHQKMPIKLGRDGVPLRPKIWARHWFEQLQAIRSQYKMS